MKKKIIKFGKRTVLFVLASFLLLYCISHLGFHRSVMASLSEFAMVVIDREKIYRVGDQYEENLEFRREENLKKYTMPDGVSLDVSLREDVEYGMQTFYFNEEAFNGTVILYLSGGAYTNNPLKFHWDIINNIAKETNNMVVMANYLKVPNYTCDESYAVMEKFYCDLSKRDGVERMIFMGDSAGGGMCLVLAQMIRDDFPNLISPEELILIAPWMDVSMENEEIKDLDAVDPMLDISGAINLGKLWAGERDVHDPMVSPIFGRFENLGRITLFASDRDMLYADIIKFSEILNEQGIEHILVTEEGLNHPYPLFPIPEAKEAQQLMIDIINEEK